MKVHGIRRRPLTRPWGEAGTGRAPIRAALAVTSLMCGSIQLTAADTLAPLELTRIAAGVYVHVGPHGEASPANQGGVSNVGVIVGERAIAVVDTGGSAIFGHRLKAAVDALSDLPVRHVINTHVHPDHTLGNVAFAEDDAVTFIGHARLARSLGDRGPHYLRSFGRLIGAAFDGTHIVAPTMAVKDRLEIDLGNRILELEAHATAHTDNDLTVFDRTGDVLFAGDLVFMERLPVVDGSILGWMGVIETLKAHPARMVVPGHGPASAPWPGALDDQRRYLGKLVDGIRALIAQNATMSEAIEQVAQDERERWLLFDDNHPRNVTTSFAELEWE